MSENDTFNRLRRDPFRKLFIETLDPMLVGEDIVPENRKKMIEDAGWTWEEFNQVVANEMLAENITGSVTELSSPVWRAKFLKLEPIY